MQEIILPAGAKTPARKRFYSQIVEHINDITYAECEIALIVEQDQLVIQRRFSDAVTQVEQVTEHLSRGILKPSSE